MAVMGQDGSVVPEGAPAEGQVPPEVLVRFWPELFGVPVVNGKKSAPLVGRTGRVDWQPLATHLLAVPLFTLIRDGLVRAESTERKLLGLVPLHRVMLTPTGSTTPATGLAAALLPGKPIDAKALVYRWFGTDVASPERHVVVAVAKVGEQSGLYTAEQPPPHRVGLVGRKVASAVQYRPVIDRVAGTRAAAESLAAQWDEFGRDDAQLRDRLVQRVHKGIRSREESDDDDDWFDG
jgi:hypothetical protein